jgi:DNA polymerase-3 subunit delta'
LDYLSANTLPWLEDAQQRLRAAHAAGRLPHSILVLSPPGLGAELLANWTSAFTLCESSLDRPARDEPGRVGPGRVEPARVEPGHVRPCGICGSCRLLSVDSHPDHHLIRLEDDAQQIKVEQVREFMEPLTLKSYRGGYKIGVIEDADTLNTFGANAFLKTLEEPGGDTVLIMIARPTHRLPATIASRCQRLVLRVPPSSMAIAWLENSAPKQPWGAALELAGGAPLRARQFEPQDLAALDEDMQACMGQVAAGSVDISLVAERWLRSNLELRISWLENWITRRVRACFGLTNSTQSAEPVVLPGALLKPKITPLFGLLDAARDFRRLASTGMNQQLALEALLLEGLSALRTWGHAGTVGIAKSK